MNKYLITILKKMCSVVGADYSKIDFKEAQWFWKYEWSQGQEDKFKEWMIKYLTDNKEARKFMMEYPRKTKKVIKKLVDEFIWNWGWKVKE